MSRRRRVVAVIASVTCLSVAALAKPARARMMMDEEFFFQPTFELQGPAIGKAAKPDQATPAHLAGSTIALVGKGALVLDGDSGQLVLVDAAGKATARLDVGHDAGQLVYDQAAGRAYVSDRRGDQIVAVTVAAKKLTEAARWKTPVEPWGLALSPDGKTLLVTTIADRTLVALSTDTGKPAWSRTLSREPRGVAVSPDGATALVSYLHTGTVERVELDGEHLGAHVALLGASAAASFQAQPVTGFVAAAAPARAFARNAFAVRYLGNGLAIVGHQQSTPVQIADGGNTGSYGGGFEPPVDHRIAFIGTPDGAATPSVSARVVSHQPNALGWDPAADTLVIAGYGSDDILVIGDASQSSVALRSHVPINADGSCGPEGVAVADGTAWVWCSLSRKVARVDLATSAVTYSAAAISKSRRSDLEQLGLALFRGGNDGRISQRGAMACSSCHPDGRADGLSWQIEGHTLQTPVLDGRVAGTHPYKWDGGDADLTISLTSTMRRLGGTGLGDSEVKALTAFLESRPAPRTPSRDRKQVARGKKLFGSAGAGCNSCHAGKKFTDRGTHELGTDIKAVDTPSLIGLASSAPYYHDGSAATLDALLRDTALVHGMADLEDLDEQDIADLTAFLETL